MFASFILWHRNMSNEFVCRRSLEFTMNKILSRSSDASAAACV